VVDNINGSIEVSGYTGRDVKLLCYRTIVARSKEKLARARREIQLEISEQDNSIVIYVDAPYRERDGSINYRGWRYYGYKVEHDFEIKVPEDTDFFLKTINNGEIRVHNVKGDFDLDNVNGGIEVEGAAGSGRAYALNGMLRVQFDENPRSDCYFGSLNGKIEVAFQQDLSADLRFKTFNGEVYTDFPVTYLTPRKPTRDRKNGKFVYKSDRSFGARIGRGGREIEFDGFNGNIYVVRQ
ncbi:hypothetical protein MJD09_02760, partial [bacterium]|nr:hypothetical protein [bacterium]